MIFFVTGKRAYSKRSGLRKHLVSSIIGIAASKSS